MAGHRPRCRGGALRGAGAGRGRSRIGPSARSASFPGKVTAVAFHARRQRGWSRRRASPGWVGVASIWNVADGSLDPASSRATATSSTTPSSRPTASALATCGYDKTIELWDAETGKLIRTLEGHNGAVYDVAFSPDGRFLVSASADDTCKVWRVDDGLRHGYASPAAQRRILAARSAPTASRSWPAAPTTTSASGSSSRATSPKSTRW